MKIGIFAQTGVEWDEYILGFTGIGGAETWAIQTAEHLSKKGYDVTIYGKPKVEHTSVNGAKYKFFTDYDNEYFDVAILSRSTEIFDKVNSENIFSVAHDNSFYEFTEKIYNDKRFKGIGVLSEWHKKHLKELYPFLADEKIFFFSNGYDAEFYQDIDNVKENAMVWSSSPYRRFDLVANKVLPLIKEKIPDFKIYACFYDDDETFAPFLSDDIIFVGNLDKKRLSEIQKKSKIWIYPNMGINSDGTLCFETFCITALENAMAGNAIITNDGGGLSTTLRGYKNLMSFDDVKWMGEDEYATLLANTAISFLKEQDTFDIAVKNLQDISKNKTWENVTEDLIKEITKPFPQYYNFRGRDIYPIDYGDQNKVLLVAIARWENKYNLLKWVEHYKNLGFDKIYIGDNNDIGDDSLSEVLGKYIKDGFVGVIDCRGEKVLQVEFYSMFSMLGNYKWCAYFDCDEYLELNYCDNIKTYLSNKDDKDIVHFNWVAYGNDSTIVANDKSYPENFLYPLPLNTFYNISIKSIVNGRRVKNKKLLTHTIEGYGGYHQYATYKDGYLKHYKFRSIEEQLKCIKRGNAVSEIPYNKDELRNFDSQYHNDLLKNKYEGWTFFNEYAELKCGDNEVIWLKCDDIFPIVGSMMRLMKTNTNKLFFIDYKDYLGNELPDFIFNLLFEYALHTGNKVCIDFPILDNGFKYIQYVLQS